MVLNATPQKLDEGSRMAWKERAKVVCCVISSQRGKSLSIFL
jgi:hypothetical protein